MRRTLSECNVVGSAGHSFTGVLIYAQKQLSCWGGLQCLLHFCSECGKLQVAVFHGEAQPVTMRNICCLTSLIICCRKAISDCLHECHEAACT